MDGGKRRGSDRERAAFAFQASKEIPRRSCSSAMTISDPHRDPLTLPIDLIERDGSRARAILKRRAERASVQRVFLPAFEFSRISDRSYASRMAGKTESGDYRSFLRGMTAASSVRIRMERPRRMARRLGALQIIRRRLLSRRKSNFGLNCALRPSAAGTWNDTIEANLQSTRHALIRKLVKLDYLPRASTRFALAHRDRRVAASVKWIL